MSGAGEEELSLADETATRQLGAKLAVQVRAGDVILLEGPLGAGKTTFVRAMVGALGGDEAEVCSPTFILLETYLVDAPGLRRFHHVDLYRLQGLRSAAFRELGLDEAFEDVDAVTAVEWPEELAWDPKATNRVLQVHLDYDGDGRKVRVEWVGGSAG